jgi:hypothetical protein
MPLQSSERLLPQPQPQQPHTFTLLSSVHCRTLVFALKCALPHTRRALEVTHVAHHTCSIITEHIVLHESVTVHERSVSEESVSQSVSWLVSQSHDSSRPVTRDGRDTDKGSMADALRQPEFCEYEGRHGRCALRAADGSRFCPMKHACPRCPGSKPSNRLVCDTCSARNT